jgi:hypothetical protein
MVHFPGFARSQLWIHWDVLEFYPSGFPHSEIPGSMPACGSPRLIAACHVLHRLLLPRHPPCALSSLTIKFTRHTAASLPAFSYQLSAISKIHHTPRKLYGPRSCSSHATYVLLRDLCVLCGYCFRLHHSEHAGPEEIRAAYTSRFLSGTHKNLQRLVIYPIYSVVKYRPRGAAISRQLSAIS